MSHAVKIVMVEDDLGHAKLIEKNIRRANISNEIAHFADGGSAMDYLFSEEVRLNGPMLILLDLNLPDMSGTDIQRCYDLGCNVYITKPVDYESFAGAIRQLGLFLSVMQAPDIE
jgi:DNA-binding response OmpR family regulator